LDELQAAVLRARLPRLAGWTTTRRELAARYRARLPRLATPVAEREPGHVYHLFPVRVRARGRADDRSALQAHLRACGIETLIHYPVALNQQPAFAAYEPSARPVPAPATQHLLSLQ